MTEQPDRSLALKPTALILPAVALACALWSYWTTLGDVTWRWGHDPQYSHGYLVPAFAAVLLYLRRGRPRGGARRGDRRGGRPLGGGGEAPANGSSSPGLSSCVQSPFSGTKGVRRPEGGPPAGVRASRPPAVESSTISTESML